MSVAIIPLSEQLSLSLKQQSFVLSYFYIGYLPMQIGGAILSRRFGGKAVLSYAAFLWSLFTVLTPLAAEHSFHMLLKCRIAMGFAEGAAFPTIFHFLSSWIPSNERARAIAVVLTGVHIGTTLALVASPIIIRHYSWQMVFYSFGTVGLLWIAVWNFFAYDCESGKQASHTQPDLPSTCESTSCQTAVVNFPKSIDNKVSPSSIPPTKPLETRLTPHLACMAASPELRIVRTILGNRSTLAVCLTQAMFNLVHYTILSWLPTYFKRVYDVKTTDLSFTFLPYFSMAVFANLGGFFADWLLRRGLSIIRVRKSMTIISTLGASLSMLLFVRATSVEEAIALVSLSMAFTSLNSGGFESSFFDMSSPSLTGLFKATANTMASISGFVAVPFSMFVLELLDGSWRGMFGSLALWYLAMLAVFCKWATSEKVLTEGIR